MLITAEQFKQHLQNLTGTAEDASIEAMIARADGLMAASCGFPLPDTGGHTLEDVQYTIFVDAPAEHPRVVNLGVRPIVSVTSAHADQNWDYDSSTLIASGDYVLDANGGRLWLRPDASSSWATSPRANKIVVVAGFPTTPPGLIALCAAAVRHLLDGNQTGSVASISQGGQTYTMADANVLLPRAVVDGLAPYRNWGSCVG